MRLTDIVAIKEHARLRHARSARFRLWGIFLGIFSAAVIVTGLLPLAFWDLGDPDANGAAVYLSFFLLYIGWALIDDTAAVGVGRKRRQRRRPAGIEPVRIDER